MPNGKDYFGDGRSKGGHAAHRSNRAKTTGIVPASQERPVCRPPAFVKAGLHPPPLRVIRKLPSGIAPRQIVLGS